MRHITKNTVLIHEEIISKENGPFYALPRNSEGSVLPLELSFNLILPAGRDIMSEIH